jgi:hypothetical protein
MKTNDKNTILLAVHKILQGKPGTINHTGTTLDNKVEFSAEVDGKTITLIFSEKNYNFFNKIEGLDQPLFYDATCFVDGIRAFVNLQIDLNSIRDIYTQIRWKMVEHTDAYLSTKQALKFLNPLIPIGTIIDMPEPTEKGDYWNHEFTGTLVSYERGFAVIRDSEENHFDIEPHRLVISIENE